MTMTIMRERNENKNNNAGEEIVKTTTVAR